MASLATYNEHCMPLDNPTPQPQAFGKAIFRKDLALKFHGLGGIWHRIDHLDSRTPDTGSGTTTPMPTTIRTPIR